MTSKGYPDRGLIVVANHPYGGIEGLILLKILGAVRPETKVVSNFLLKHIPNLNSYFIGINPFHEEAHPSNIAGIRQVLASMEKGIPVVIFPAGEVLEEKLASQKHLALFLDWHEGMA